MPAPDASTEQQSATARPKGPAPAKPRARSQLASTPLGSFVARVLLGAAGLGLVLGFFLPWVSIGGAAAISGLGLLVTQGELVDLITGPYRILLFAVPLLGSGLLVGALSGHRITVWLALAAGIAVLSGGLYTVIRLFLSSTGLGMWVVVASALISLAVGLLTMGRRSS